MKAIFTLASVLLLVVAAGGSVFMARSAHADNVTNAIAAVPIPVGLDQSQEAGTDVKLVLLALLPEGFDSNEMRLDPGEYLFIIGNRTGLREIDLKLEREGNERVAAAAAGRRHRDWKKRLKLTTGTYVITANNNSNWTCRITVAP